MEIIFWVSVFLIVYAYAGFPLIIWLRSRFKFQPINQGEVTPSVTIVIAAHNEAAVIGRRIENLLSLDYPKEKLSILIASDGSDDGTNEVVSGFAQRGVTLLPLPKHGKVKTLNAAAATVESEVIVFSDANSMFEPTAVRKLVRSFADPRVGGVAGNQSYAGAEGESVAGLGERLYWRYDQWLKRMQSQSGNIISATGAIYCIRRELFQPVPPGVCDDAVISYRVIASGLRMIYEPEAIAYEKVAPSAGAEFMRKVRVCVRGLRALLVEPALFNPLKSGFYALQLLSHKLIRWLVAWPLMLLFVASLILAPTSTFYQSVAVLQIVFYCMAIAAFLLRNTRLPAMKLFKPMTIPFYFCMTYVATLIAQYRLVNGERIDSWEVNRSHR